MNTVPLPSSGRPIQLVGQPEGRIYPWGACWFGCEPPDTWCWRDSPPESPGLVDLKVRGPLCLVQHPSSRALCTRHQGHGGRHAAGNGRHIIQVWR